MQSQKAVTSYFSNKQLLSFASAEQRLVFTVGLCASQRSIRHTGSPAKQATKKDNNPCQGTCKNAEAIWSGMPIHASHARSGQAGLDLTSPTAAGSPQTGVPSAHAANVRMACSLPECDVRMHNRWLVKTSHYERRSLATQAISFVAAPSGARSVAAPSGAMSTVPAIFRIHVLLELWPRNFVSLKRSEDNLRKSRSDLMRGGRCFVIMCCQLHHILCTSHKK